MRQTKVARTYAKSLLDLAVEKGELENVKTDMDFVFNTCKESKELQAMLASPVVPANKKVAVLKELFGKSVSSFTSSFIELLAQKGREAILLDISYSFATIYLAHKNILKAVITSVDGVSDGVKNKVKELVKNSYNKEVLIEEVKDASLIGGFIITVEDKQVDASVSKQLANLHNTFS